MPHVAACGSFKMEKLNQLVSRLQRIAKKNDDAFRYRIDIKPGCNGGVVFLEFVAEETADGHCFTSGSGTTIDAAVDIADAEIKNALGEWGYEE